MQAFRIHKGLVAPMDRENVDTDAIIPKQFLKTVEREGLGKGLFFDFRFDPNGNEIADFVLNRPEYKGSSVLIAGDNFGCGSSREHAPWALMDFGILCVISTSFADIFNNNCFNNGLLPVVLAPDEVSLLMDEAKGGNHMVSVDLEAQTVVSEAANYANAGHATRVIVVGHTDTSGSPKYNVKLSERRAKAVADALVSQGVSKDVLGVDWKGESAPAVATGDGVKEPLNRRSTISINF